MINFQGVVKAPISFEVTLKPVGMSRKVKRIAPECVYLLTASDRDAALQLAAQTHRYNQQGGSMNLTGKPIPLPLDPSINRCLGHGHNKGEWCDRLATCAAHQTISHDAQVFAPAAYRKCMTDNMAAYLPIDGFQAEEEAA